MMKKIIRLSGLTMVLMAFVAFKSVAQEVMTQGGPSISVNKETHDYGTVKYAGDGKCEFIVTNTGTTDLLITEARGSCGCTVPTVSKDPIPPGKSTTIVVTYDTNREGPFSKTVTIMSNATNEPVKVVKIKGEVELNPNKPVTPPTPQPATTTPGH